MRHQRDDPGSCSCSSSQCGTNEIDATCMLISSVGLTLAMFVPVQGLLPGLHPERVQRQLDDRLRRHLQHLVPTRNGTSLFTSETHHHFRNASSSSLHCLPCGLSSSSSSSSSSLLCLSVSHMSRPSKAASVSSPSVLSTRLAILLRSLGFGAVPLHGQVSRHGLQLQSRLRTLLQL